MSGPPARAELALTGVALAWGASFVVIKDALDAVSPQWLLFARFGVATIAVGALVPRALGPPLRPSLRPGLALGAILYAAFALQTVGLVFTSPAKSAFLTATYVPMVPLLARLLLGVPLSTGVVASVGLAFAGLALLTHPADLGAVNRGDVLTLACAAGFALHIVALARVAPGVPARPLAVLQLAATGALALPAALALEGPPPEPAAGWIGAALFLGIVCSAWAYLVQTWAQRVVPPSRVALIFALESVFAAGFAVALRGERLTPGEWIGGALVVAAVLTGRRGSLPAGRAVESSPPGEAGGRRRH